jgi:hypothetical protein
MPDGILAAKLYRVQGPNGQRISLLRLTQSTSILLLPSPLNPAQPGAEHTAYLHLRCRLKSKIFVTRFVPLQPIALGPNDRQ